MGNEYLRAEARIQGTWTARLEAVPFPNPLIR